MKVAIILLLIIIAACLANSTIRTFYEGFKYGNGEDYYPDRFVSNECPCLSCINQPRASPYKS